MLNWVLLIGGEPIDVRSPSVRFGPQQSRPRAPPRFAIRQTSWAPRFERPDTDLDAADEALIRSVRHLSMTEQVSQWEFIRAVRFVELRGVPGDTVECGVWRGGYFTLAGMLRDQLGFDRQIGGFDIFTGMTPPGEFDRKAASKADFATIHAGLNRGEYNEWCYASLEEVKANFTRLAGSALRTVKGRVEETLRNPANLPERISILRLDTGLYESTKEEMNVLYPRLSPGGVSIIDDYGEWQGARKAVAEYFAGKPVWLERVTASVRMMIKD